MVSEKKILELFAETGVLLEGHFLLTSGMHSERYLQCARVFQYPLHAATLCSALAYGFLEEKIDVCVGPALGGVIIAYETARALGVRGLFTERDKDGAMALRRGFQIRPGERVLVLEDVVTTGESVREVISLVKELGGIVIGVGSLVDRGSSRVDFGVPYKALLSLDIKTFNAEDCPMCRKGLPVEKPGSRK
jgi:orotate phosphoribosyltransferase